MKEKKLLARLISSGITAAVMIQSLPVMPLGQILAADRAEEEALRNELLAYSDDFPEGAIEFYEDKCSMTEGDGDREITVVRLGDPKEAMSVDVKAYDVSAQYGEDYTMYTKVKLKKNFADDSQVGAPNVQTAMENGDFRVEDGDTSLEDLLTREEFASGEPVAPAEETDEDDAEYEIIVAQTSEAEKTDTAEEVPEDSDLRSAFRDQTGQETVNTNWRGEYEQELAEEAAKAADNEVVDSFDGAFLTLNFEPGEYKKTIYIHVNDDDKAESTESASLILGNATSGLIATQMQYTVNIEDNEETEPIVFAMKDSEIITDRGATYAEVTVERTSGIDYYANLTYRTASGTAESYAAYAPSDGQSVAFAAGQTEQNIRIELSESAKVGSYFTVLIDEEFNNAEENRAETRVYIGSKNEDLADILDVPTPTTVSVQNADPYAPLPQKAPSLISVNDTNVMASDSNSNVYSVPSSMLGGCETWHRYNIPEMANAQFVEIEYKFPSIWRKSAGIEVTADKMNMGSSWKKLGNVKIPYNYDNRYNPVTGKVIYSLGYPNNYNMLCIDGIGWDDFYVTSIKLYYPNDSYTLISTNENQKLEGKNYTSVNEFTNFNVDSFDNWKSSYAGETYDVKRNGGTVFFQNFSSRLANGVEVKSVDVYAGEPEEHTYISDIIVLDDYYVSRYEYNYIKEQLKKAGKEDYILFNGIGKYNYDDYAIAYKTTTNPTEAIKNIVFLSGKDLEIHENGKFEYNSCTYNLVRNLNEWRSDYIGASWDGGYICYTKDDDGSGECIDGLCLVRSVSDDSRSNIVDIYKDRYSGKFSDKSDSDNKETFFNKMFFRSYDGQQYQEGNLNVSKHKTNYIGRITGVEGGKISFDTIEKMMNTAGKKGAIIESDNKLHLVPIFTAKPAEVKFAAEEETVVGFSGSKNVKGFKVGQTLNCTQIDKVTMTASDVTEGQNVYPCDIDRESYNYELVKNKNTDKWEYVKKNSPAVFKSLQDGKTDITATVDIDYDKEIFTACYNRPTLTFEYTPSEVNSSTSKWGGIMVSPYNDTNNVVGAGDFETPVKITSQDLAVLRTTYVATAIIDDAKDVFDSIYYDNAGNEIKIPMRTKTVWTYYDKNQKRNTTAQGNSFAFRPWFNNDTVYYHFIAEQLNEELRGLSGKVYTQEVPLFSGEGAQKESTPAVGVDLLVGGYNGRTGSDGSYSISPHFNLGDNLTVFAKYDSLQYTDNAIISMGTTHDIIIDVNENDALSVTSSVMEKDQVTNEAKDPLRIGVVQKTYVRQNTTCMLLEDTNYYLSLNAKGSAGFVPKEAEFRIYSKKGEYKSDLTKRVAFTLNGNEGSLTYKLNPMSVNGNKLEIGDTFTVTLYDKEGNKYFEHHTGIVVAEPLTQMFLFNYDSWSKEDDSAFVSALGNISLGYDFALDVLTSPGVTYDDNGKTHMFCSIGFGESTNNPKALFNKATQTKNMLDEMEHGTYTPDKYTELGFGGGSSSGTPDDFKATGNSSWNLKIQIAMILDCIVEKTDPDRKGQMYFNDFLIIAGCTAKYERTWNIPVKAVTINIRLSFAVNPLADGFGSGIRWHFSNADDKVKNYITKETDESKNSDNKQGNSTINLLAWDGTKSYGDIGFNITIFADFNVDIKGIFSVGGSINVNVENHVLFKDNSLSDIGAVNLSPTVYITITFLKIPLWSTTFNWPWVNDNIKHSPPELKPPTDEEIQTDILFNKTSDREIIDFSELYANREWGGSVFRQFAPGNPESAEEVTEAVLQKGFYSESDIRVQDLGNGKYFATFIDLVPGRATPDAFGAYYSIYNGKTWSVPQLLEDDGTADDIPTICNAGSKGWLIVWSDASRKLDENENVGSMLNTYDLTGRFFNPETNKLGDVMEITKTSGSDDVCDTSPEISYYEENGQEFMKIYYTKSEYSVSSEEDGEVIGDILNPYELKAIRNYDFVNDKWAEDYSGKTKEYLMGKYGEKYSDYVKKWYGQEFLTLAPPLEVNESVDDIGYWKNGTTATVAETDLSQAMAKDSAVITYNNLSLQAYTLDKGGMAQENQDENLYLQIYNYHDDEYHHPILISGNNAEISDLQFVRMPVQTDNGTTEVTYLYWLEDYCIKRINISSLVKNSLVLGKTSTGQEYYYIDKTAGSAFEPEQVLVKPTITVNDEGEESIDEAVTSFKVRQNGDYNYLMWIEALQKVDENSKQKMEQQLFAMRENSAKSEMTLPVQITDKEDQFINRFDFAVTDNGELDVLADRIMIGEDGHVDTNTSELTSFHIKPSDKLVISEVSDASIALNDDGSLAAQVNMTLENKNFNTQQNVIVEVQDENGNVVYTTDKPFATYEVNESVLEGGNFVSGDFTKTETEFKLDMIGGQTQPASVKIPMGRDGKYAGKVVLKVDGNVVETRELSGQLKPELQADRFIAAVTDRNEIRLDATVKNINYLESEESTVKYGYLDADGNQVELGTTNIVSLDSNEETDFNVTASIDFDKFVSEFAEDGSITDTLQFYLEGDNFDTVYSTVSLSATSEEYKLMTELKNTDAKLSQYNTDGDLEKLEAFNVGDIGYMNLWLEDDFVQNIDQYTGRTKLVWTEKSDSVASITRNGVVTANGDGTTTLNGYIVPADTESILFEDGTSEAVDNFVSKPSEVIIPISANITVGDGSPEQTGNIATDDEIREWAIADYQGKNAKLVSVSTLKVQDDGKYEISFFDEVGNPLDKYVIDPKTGKGTNAANEAIDLPQTGMNSIAKMLIVVSALLMMWIGLTLVIYSGGFRRKRDEKETE